MAGPSRVVIVDDAPRTLENLKKLLSLEPDVEVVATAASASAGIEEARRHKPDLILMDVNLPDMDGIRATELLTAELPNVPVVIISVQDDREYLRRAMQAGAREYLVKPFSGDELTGAIRRVSQVEARKRAQAPAAATAPAPPPPPAPVPAPPVSAAPPAGSPLQPRPMPADLAASVTTQLSRDEIASALGPKSVEAIPTTVQNMPAIKAAAPAPAPVATPPPSPPPPSPAPAAARPAPIAAPPPAPPAPIAAPPPPAPPAPPLAPPRPPEPVLIEPAPAPAAPPPPLARRHSNGVVTLLFSGKGGVGKSVLAINIAAELARETGEDVALVDLNLQFGDIEVLLGLDAPGTIIDIARAYPNVDAPFIGSLMPQIAGQVRVLAGPRSPELADLIHGEHIKLTLDLLRQAFEHVVIDCQTHLDDRTLEALEAADNIVLLTDLNIPAIKDAKLAFKLFESLHVSRERIFLVLNRSNAPSNVTVAQLEANLRCPVSVQIPSEGKLVLTSIQKAAPFVLLFPDQQISQKVKEVVGLLVPLAGAAKESGAKGGRRKLFGRGG